MSSDICHLCRAKASKKRWSWLTRSKPQGQYVKACSRHSIEGKSRWFVGSSMTIRCGILAIPVARSIFRISPGLGSKLSNKRWGLDPNRLTTPLIKEEGTFREASWDEALDLVAKKFNDIKSEHGPDSLGVLTSARITNEENYIAQKFARAVLKTNSVDHCARL